MRIKALGGDVSYPDFSVRIGQRNCKKVEAEPFCSGHFDDRGNMMVRITDTVDMDGVSVNLAPVASQLRRLKRDGRR